MAAVTLVSVASRSASAQSGAWTDRARITMNAGDQESSVTFASSTTKPVYSENAIFNATYPVPRGFFFDGGVLVRVAGNFGLGAAVSSLTKQQAAATVTGSIPHPFFLNTPRSFAGTVTGLQRSELVAHVQAAYVVASGTLDLVFSGGPSFFSATQDLVSDVSFAETVPPYNTVTFTGASTTRVRRTGLGFNAGADVGIRFAEHVGVGGMVRFSKASLVFPLAGSAADVASDAGGLEAGAGLRFFF